jgi:hypothetical protein
MTPNKRELLLALAALGAGALLPAAAAQHANGPDLTAATAIAESYRAAFPGEDLAALRRELIPSGADTAALSRMRGAVAADFRGGRSFIHQGWRLSRTEGRLFALVVA